MDDDTLANLLVMVRLGVVTILLWVGSRLWDMWIAQRRLSEDRDAFIRAIYAEIDFNTWDMTRFLNATVPVDVLEGLFETKPDFVPHITDARHTEVYRSRIDELHAVAGGAGAHDTLVGEIVRFYGELEKVTQQIEGLTKPSFLAISPKGRAGTVNNIYATCRICEHVGISLLGKMEQRFSHLGLCRNVHAMSEPQSQDAAELAQRLHQLQLNLDRVNRV